MKVVVLSFIYPDVECYLYDFINSFNSQTDKEFKMFIVNDGLKNTDAFLYTKFPVMINDAEGSPAKLRKIGIDWAIREKSDIIIFADADDCFAHNRVEVIKHLIKKYHIVFNELLLFNKELYSSKPFLSNRLLSDCRIVDNDLINLNCLGLSNTAINAEIIGYDYKAIPGSTVAFDWIFFMQILQKGHEAFFTNDTITYYRQHSNNVAAPFLLNDKQIEIGVQVKYQHYLMLSNTEKQFLKKANSYRVLIEKLKSDEPFCKVYCDAVRLRAPKVPLWWEPIKTPEELGL